MKFKSKALAPTILLVLLSGGCKVTSPKNVDRNGKNDRTEVVDPGTPTPSPTPTPTPTPTETTSLSGAAAIASNFDTTSLLTTAPIPASSAPDVVGAFRFVCGPGQLRSDDPIVFPGQPGKSHLHQFYGNTSTDANSTYASLRSGGESTCMNALNRSAYWMPAMLDGKGNAIRPDHVQIYYKRRPQTDPKCQEVGGAAQGEGICVDLPNGLKFIFGYDMVTGKAPTGSLYFQCVGTGADASHSANLVQAAPKCVSGGRITAVVKAPGCWDGKNLDSPNHRDHVAYTDYGTWGYNRCPTTHPYRIPAFTLLASYSIVSGDNIANWRFSSDEMHPNLPHGSTYHADFFMAWDPTVLQMWHDNCINKLLSCSAGNLGNGKNLKQMSPVSTPANPRLVALSSLSTTMMAGM